VTPELRRRAAELYGTPEDAASGLAAYTNEQLEFLVGFLRDNAAYQEERIRRLDGLKAKEVSGGRSTDRGAGATAAKEKPETTQN
jgi:hypothetical protein